MAETLRNQNTLPDQPNMNVVPPAAPLGTADAATTAGASARGDSIPPGNHRHDYDNLLEPYSEDREREWPLGAIVGGGGGVWQRAGERLRSSLREIQNGSWTEELRDRAEGFKERTAQFADNFQHSTVRLSHQLQHGAAEWMDRTESRAQDVRAATEQLINQRPARAIAVAAGIGLALGIVLRLGRSHREY